MASEEKDNDVLRIGNGDGWTFLGPRWRDGESGELLSPDTGIGGAMAVAHDHEYSDFQARFRFKFGSTRGGARLLFGVQDATRYYALDVPWGGQQSRARHMWAGIVRADGTPLQRYLSFKLIPGVPPDQAGQTRVFHIQTQLLCLCLID